VVITLKRGGVVGHDRWSSQKEKEKGGGGVKKNFWRFPPVRGSKKKPECQRYEVLETGRPERRKMNVHVKEMKKKKA